MRNRKNINTSGYEKEFSDEGFMGFIKKFARVFPGIRDAVAMFYCLKDPDTPVWVKSIIIGVLGYLISPIDAVPDVIPGLGLLDDLGVLTTAMATIRANVKQFHWKQADELLF